MTHHKDQEDGRAYISIIEDKMVLMHEQKNYPSAEVKFFKEAITEVVRCHNMLKWTYVYGYYCILGDNKIKMDLY